MRVDNSWIDYFILWELFSPAESKRKRSKPLDPKTLLFLLAVLWVVGVTNFGYSVMLGMFREAPSRNESTKSQGPGRRGSSPATPRPPHITTVAVSTSPPPVVVVQPPARVSTRPSQAREPIGEFDTQLRERVR